MYHNVLITAQTDTIPVCTGTSSVHTLYTCKVEKNKLKKKKKTIWYQSDTSPVSIGTSPVLGVQPIFPCSCIDNM